MNDRRPTRVIVESNGLGTAGFVVSLIGLLSCGLLSPIGLLLSLFGLGKKPNGLAIAGVILGLLGSGFFFFVGMALVLGALGLGAAITTATQVVTTTEAMDRLSDRLVAHHAQGSRYPTTAEVEAAVGTEQDAWGRDIRYRPLPDGFELRSFGPDGEPHNDDDIVRSTEVGPK